LLYSIYLNPLGYWTGGINVDSGATNRKLGSDMGDSITGGGLHGKDLSKADVSVNIFCQLYAIAYNTVCYAKCSIGDTNVAFRDVAIDGVRYIPFKKMVEVAREYIAFIGGFEKFAEWGLLTDKTEKYAKEIFKGKREEGVDNGTC
jgi:S-adenosylmethionine synthetase